MLAEAVDVMDCTGHLCCLWRSLRAQRKQSKLSSRRPVGRISSAFAYLDRLDRCAITCFPVLCSNYAVTANLLELRDGKLLKPTSGKPARQVPLCTPSPAKAQQLGERATTTASRAKRYSEDVASLQDQLQALWALSGWGVPTELP